MRSPLVARSTRLVLTAVAAAALTATATGTALAAGGQGTAPDVGQVCGTTDLTFKLTEKTQAGGYLLVTAKAKSGITCYLEGGIPSASFGSSPDSLVQPIEQSVGKTIKLSGSTAAYAGINPKTTSGNYGAEYERLFLSVAGDESESVTLKLPSSTLVDRPVSTNWQAAAADAVPFSD
ncbi:DUF4232 domain-containing protein [Streptomyces sp. NPDC050147]|uniref:DUF4232 domain-containing protein n=1 Tax=Streptomyces sp. NPDC050147 TaxID=3155513 RepID=UPI00341E5FBE